MIGPFKRRKPTEREARINNLRECIQWQHNEARRLHELSELSAAEARHHADLKTMYERRLAETLTEQ